MTPEEQSQIIDLKKQVKDAAKILLGNKIQKSSEIFPGTQDQQLYQGCQKLL
jgi:hypothetical protein